MKNKNLYWIIGIVVVIIILGGVYIFNKSNNNSYNSSTNNYNLTSNLVIGSGNTSVTVKVTEATGEPITNAIVYLGDGFWRCSTDSYGICSIKNFPGGSYWAGIYKKNYERVGNSTELNYGENNFNMVLKKRATGVESVDLKGKVIIVTTAKGTRSENNYLKLKEDSGTEHYIFDEIGDNVIPNQNNFINSEVEIKGYIENGFIGWQHDEIDGIYVEMINKI